MNALGMVWPWGRRINLNPNFFIDDIVPNILDAQRYFNDTKHGILFHETTHFMNVLTTIDITYGTERARLLVSNPILYNDIPMIEAQNNATNWELFFQNYALRK